MVHEKKDCQSFWVLRVTVGTRQDWNMVIAKTGAENKCGGGGGGVGVGFLTVTWRKVRGSSV